jgi:DNA primase
MTYGDQYNEQLWGSPAADYLRNRGLLHSTITRFNLGYVERPAPGHHRYKGRISIPYSDGMGNERGIRYRKMPDDPSKAKYLAVRDFDHLFAVRASDHARVFVTEGEVDAMILWQMGYRAVGVPGAKAWKDYHRFLFRNCEEVVICFDFDEPGLDPATGRRKPNSGQIGAAKVYRSLERTGLVTRSVTLPRGQDVNDAYLELGERGLRDLLEAA